MVSRTVPGPGAEAVVSGAAGPLGSLAGRLRALDPTLAVPVAVALVVIANAWSGLMPGVGFWDTGEFQTVLPVMGTAHPTGYPTYVLIGFVVNLLLTPLGEPAFRMNVLSLLAVATAAGACVAVVRRLTDSLPIGAAAGLGLALTPIVWANATRADPHPIHLAFMALLLLALVRWQQGRDELSQAASDRRLVLAALIFGLAAGNHSLTLLLIPPIALYVLAVEPSILRRPLFVLACVAVAALTVSLVYLELPIRAGLLRAPIVYGNPTTWNGFWYIALAEQFRGSLADPLGNLPGKLGDLAMLTWQQLGPLALLIPPAFVLTLGRAPRFALLTGTAMLITVIFNAAYTNADIERYYLGPALWAWTWLGILAGEVLAAGRWLLEGRPRASSPGRPAAVAGMPWASSLGLLLALALLVPSLADLDARRAGADRSSDTEAAAWLDATLPKLAQNAVLVSWWSTSTALWYAQDVEGRRKDVFVVDDRTMLDQDLGRAPDVIRRYLGQRPVYAIRLQGRDLQELTDQFEMTQVAGSGNTAVYEVTGVRGAGG
jgi:4-amino-4-deoxy-L-arabinose transferase-like glycosyltransferase